MATDVYLSASILLKGKHCQRSIVVTGVVDTLGHCLAVNFDRLNIRKAGALLLLKTYMVYALERTQEPF